MYEINLRNDDQTLPNTKQKHNKGEDMICWPHLPPFAYPSICVCRHNIVELIFTIFQNEKLVGLDIRFWRPRGGHSVGFLCTTCGGGVFV